MINIDEVCARIYGEINAILAKNKDETDADRAFTKAEIEVYLNSLYDKKQIIMVPAVRFEDSTVGLKVQLYSGSNTKLDSIEQIVSATSQLKDLL